MKRCLIIMAASLAMVSAMSSTAYAGSWKQDNVGWWWQNDDGSYPTSCWQWLDGNGDGTAECYYFNEAGYMLANTVTPDGYTVNADGVWVVNGVAQTQAVATTTETTTTSAASVNGYPAPRHSIGRTVSSDQTYDEVLKASGAVTVYSEFDYPGSELIYRNYWWDPNMSFCYLLKAVGNLTPNKVSSTSLRNIYDSACAISATDPDGDMSDIGSGYEEALDSIYDAVAIYYDSGLITADQCAALGVTAEQIQTFFNSELGR